ncbi:MAG TPA: hypothetical protein VFQ25_11190 [Ktedonobacterales bacterium]|nr:hypothetical protein [Ktedonobacterales bacterium]
MMQQDDPGAPELEVTSLDSGMARHKRLKSAGRWLRSRPGRLTLSALTLLTVVAALAGMFARASSDPISEARTVLGMFTPTPTPVIPPGGDVFGLINAVPWGDLQIDDHAPTLTTIEPIGQGFTLPRGVHHVVYRARYFPTLHCVVSVPQAPDDTCPLSNLTVTEGLAFQRIIDLGAFPNRMAPTHYNQLTSAVNTALGGYSASATIEPGERYLNQLGKVEIAQTAMAFTMGLEQAEEPKDPNCPFLCPMDGNASVISSEWDLTARVEPTWTIKDATGRTFSSLITSAPATTYGALGPDTVTFAVVLDGTDWKVSSQDQGALDGIVQLAALEAVKAQYGPILNGTTSGRNPANGAIVTVQRDTSMPQAVLLWRFGLLYAANTDTKRQFPALPLANQQEQALAQAMAAEMSGP